MANCLFFGDSITFGEYDGISGGWVDSLKRWSYTKFNDHSARELNIFNLGIGGETTDGLVKRFPVEAEARKSPDANLIFFAYGANDLVELDGTLLVPVSQYINNLQLVISRAKLVTDEIFIISILPVATAADGIRTATGKIRTNQRVGEYNTALKELAAYTSVAFVDIYSLFFSKKDQLISPDGVHPNTKGYQFISEQIRPLLEPYL